MSGAARKMKKVDKNSAPNKRPRRDLHQSMELYEIEKILARRLNPATGQYEYRIKWIGYPDSDNTWEPEHGLKPSANWVADYSRAEEERIKFQQLQNAFNILSSVSKVPQGTFAGVDFSGLGVVIPRMQSTTTNGNGNVMQTVKEGPKNDTTGPEVNAGAGSSVAVNNPKVVSTPQTDLFQSNQKLLEKNNLLESKLEEKDKLLEKQAMELESVKMDMMGKKGEITQLRGQLEQAQQQNLTLKTSLAEMTTQRDRMAGSLAEKRGHGSTLERDLGIQTANQQLRSNLTGKDIVISILKQNCKDLQAKGEGQRSTLAKMESHYKQQLAEMNNGWEETIAENGRLNRKVDELRHKLTVGHANPELARKHRFQNNQLNKDLARMESQLQEFNETAQSCTKIIKGMRGTHEQDEGQGQPGIIDPEPGSSSVVNSAELMDEKSGLSLNHLRV